MEQVNIKRWIDYNGQEFNQLEGVVQIRIAMQKAIKYDIYVFDKDGRIFFQGKPIYAESNGEYVGIRYPMKACS